MPGTRIVRSMLCISASVLLSGAAVYAQDQPQGSASMADKHFVKTAMATDMAEIQLGQLALEKASSDDVKKFAQMMIDDHTKLDDQMKPIATQLGVTAPTEPMPKDKALMARLKALSGSAFDKAYIHAMVNGHRMADMDFKKEEASGQVQSVKDAATQGEPKVAEHMKMAQDLMGKS